MGVTADQVYLLRKSFRRVEQQTHLAALIFYQRLFTLDPAVRPLFKTNIEEQSRKLIEMLGLAISLSEKPDRLESELGQLGARHAGYGVKKEHYQVVGTALIEMLAQVLADEFTAATRQAWTDFYDFMARSMQHGAAQMSPSVKDRPRSPQIA